MAKYTYPAVFEQEPDGGYSIYFPDIEGCYTQAEDIAEGIEKASDALCLMLYELEKSKAQLPNASNLNNIKPQENGFATLIACDTKFIRTFLRENL